MPRKLRPEWDFQQQRFMQISESHCGPAVIQMLLSSQGVDVSQEDVAEAGGATALIELHGMRVDQLARAVRRLAPQLRFYSKDQATVDELARIVNEYRHPAGVEWQGVFEDVSSPSLLPDEKLPDGQPGETELMPDSESEDEDFGHYSLVVRADRRRRQFIIADPYKDYFSQARVFDFATFDERWYDFNEVPDPLTGKPVLVEDDHLLFVVVRRNVLFPQRMGMRTVSTSPE